MILLETSLYNKEKTKMDGEVISVESMKGRYIYMGKNFFDFITDELTNERLDSIVLQNPGYRETIEEVDSLAEGLKACNLGGEEAKAVNRLICAYLTQNACYCKLSYQQGFRDCAALLIELGMIKQPTE